MPSIFLGRMSAVVLASWKQALGTQLFHRTTRSLSLTNNGESYHQDLQQALSLLDAANQQVSHNTSEVRGRIKLGLLPETDELIRPILFNFHDQYPQVELDIRNITNGFNDMFQQGLDIAFHGGPLFDADIVAHKLLSLERYLVASPNYLNTYGAPTNLEQLKQHQCIGFRWPNGEVDNEWRFQDQNIKTPAKTDFQQHRLYQKRKYSRPRYLIHSQTISKKRARIWPLNPYIVTLFRGRRVRLAALSKAKNP